MLGAGSKLYFEKTGLVVTVDKEILGEGGFSTVFRASSQKEPSTKYALKKILVQTEEIGRSVMSEIRSLNLFRHPNIIKLVDSIDGRDNSNNRVIYLLFPLVQRGTLRHVLNLRNDDPDRANLDLMQVMTNFNAICSAFNYMHTLSPVRYIHQDIKPEVSKPDPVMISISLMVQTSLIWLIYGNYSQICSFYLLYCLL
jgi:serine/threonine protein kinase